MVAFGENGCETNSVNVGLARKPRVPRPAIVVNERLSRRPAAVCSWGGSGRRWTSFLSEQLLRSWEKTPEE